MAAEAESGEQALEVAPGLGSALVLMDINLGGLTGIEAARRLTTDHPELVVVLMSTYTEADLPADARRCGAAAYLHKEDLAPEVLRDLWAERHPVAS